MLPNPMRAFSLFPANLRGGAGFVDQLPVEPVAGEGILVLQSEGLGKMRLGVFCRCLRGGMRPETPDANGHGAAASLRNRLLSALTWRRVWYRPHPLPAAKC
jgi:hypothetical protein